MVAGHEAESADDRPFSLAAITVRACCNRAELFFSKLMTSCHAGHEVRLQRRRRSFGFDCEVESHLGWIQFKLSQRPYNNPHPSDSCYMGLPIDLQLISSVVAALVSLSAIPSQIKGRNIEVGLQKDQRLFCSCESAMHPCSGAWHLRNVFQAFWRLVYLVVHT